ELSPAASTREQLGLRALPLGDGDVRTFDSVERSIAEGRDHDLVPRSVEFGSTDSTNVESPDGSCLFDRSSSLAHSGSCPRPCYLPGLGFFACSGSLVWPEFAD